MVWICAGTGSDAYGIIVKINHNDWDWDGVAGTWAESHQPMYDVLNGSQLLTGVASWNLLSIDAMYANGL